MYYRDNHPVTEELLLLRKRQISLCPTFTVLNRKDDEKSLSFHTIYNIIGLTLRAPLASATSSLIILSLLPIFY